MKKLLLVIVIGVFLAGCGSDNNPGTNDPIEEPPNVQVLRQHCSFNRSTGDWSLTVINNGADGAFYIAIQYWYDTMPTMETTEEYNLAKGDTKTLTGEGLGYLQRITFTVYSKSNGEFQATAIYTPIDHPLFH